MKRKVLLSVFISLMTVFVLAACATSGGNTNDDGNSSGGKSKSKDKNEVTVALQENVQTLDTHESSSVIDISVIITMDESLLTPDQDGELESLLREDYSISDDGLSYTFQLREDVEFTDGEPFNAEAVKANVDRILDSEGAINSYKGLR